MTYYIHSAEIQKGPYTFLQLKTMWHQGILTADTLYCTESSSDWLPLKDLIEPREPSDPEIPKNEPILQSKTFEEEMEGAVDRLFPPPKPSLWPQIFLCLAMTVPAVLAAKFFSYGIFDSVIKGFYSGSRRPGDDTYLFLTEFVSCGIAGFIFVWVGALTTPKTRYYSVWFFSALAIIAALFLSNFEFVQSVFGQSTGAIIAALIFRKK